MFSNLGAAFRGAAFAVLAMSAGLPSNVSAQGPTATPKPSQAYIRFWNVLPKTPENNLALFVGDKEAITAAAPGNYNADYVPARVGSYQLTIRRLSATSGGFQNIPVVLADKSFITLLATEKDGQPTVEMFNDTPDPKVIEGFARINLRQFFPGAHVKVSVVDGPSSQSLDYGQTAVLENVPPNGQTSILLQAVLPTTPPSSRTWNLTGNFSVARHATLLLVADTYGRFRPHLVYDGQIGPLPDSVPISSPSH